MGFSAWRQCVALISVLLEFELAYAEEKGPQPGVGHAAASFQPKRKIALRSSSPLIDSKGLSLLAARSHGRKHGKAGRQEPIVVDDPEWHPEQVAEDASVPPPGPPAPAGGGQAQPTTAPAAGGGSQQPPKSVEPAPSTGQEIAEEMKIGELGEPLEGNPLSKAPHAMSTPPPGAPQSIEEFKNPPTDLEKKETWVWWFCTTAPCILFGMVCFILFVYYFGHILGASIVAGVEEFDQEFIGVDVTIGKLVVSPLRGYIHVKDFVVHNPPGYKTPHMMKAENVKVDIDTWSYARARGKRLEVEQINFEHFEVIFEKRSLTESNFSHVLHHLAKKEKEEGVDPALKNTEATAVVSTADDPGKEHRKQQKKTPRTETGEATTSSTASKHGSEDIVLALREVLISDIGARVSAGIMSGAGFRVFHLSEIWFDDFAESVGEAPWKAVVKVLLKSVMKVILADVVGERVANWVM